MAQRVEGLNRMLKDLKAAEVDMKDMKAVFGQIASEAAAVAAELAPKRSGRLRRSIKGSRSANYAAVMAGVGRMVDYAGPINYGWRRQSVKAEPAERTWRGRGKSTVVKRAGKKVIGRNIKGAHFMQRADRLMRPRVQQLLIEGVADILRRKGLT